MGKNNLQIATFAAGCFWGVEELFRNVKGVKDVVSGYTGGHVSNPTYKQVCTGTTGHAESVRVSYDPDEVPYEQLLKVFWDNHNPTTVNRQGLDVGHQYRSVVFYHTGEQKMAAEKMKEELSGQPKYHNSIVTEITQAGEFYPAEEYHQQYLRKHGQVACHI